MTYPFDPAASKRDRLEVALAALRWSGADLAAVTGVSVSTARRWRTGEAIVPGLVLLWLSERALALLDNPPPRLTEDGWAPWD
jgi:transcriptional regulator with XRE-family HTH domain